MVGFNENDNSSLLNLMSSFLGEPKFHKESKCQLGYDCPICSAEKGLVSDGKGNLEVNYKLGVYNCWVCSETHGTKGSIYKLFKDLAPKWVQIEFYKQNFLFYWTQEFNESKDGLKKIILPETFVSLSGNKKYGFFNEPFNYLNKRGITDELIDKFNIGFCTGGTYKNRIIVPSYDIDGYLNYFVGRTIFESKKYKYLNPSFDKTKFIFNELYIDWEKTIFLVEGVFDHIVVPNSIPLLGKHLYDKVFEALYLKAKSNIIIALDSDANENSNKLFYKLNAGRLMDRVFVNYMPKGHDVSSLNQIYGRENLYKWLKEKNFKLYD
jgi:hypothetical protein